MTLAAVQMYLLDNGELVPWTALAIVVHICILIVQKVSERLIKIAHKRFKSTEHPYTCTMHKLCGHVFTGRLR